MPGTQWRRRIAEEKTGSMFFLVCSLSFLDYWNFIFLVVFHCFHFGAKRDRCSQAFHTARCIFDMMFSFLFSFFLWLHFRANDFWSFDIPLVPVPFVFFLALPKLRLYRISLARLESSFNSEEASIMKFMLRRNQAQSSHLPQATWIQTFKKSAPTSLVGWYTCFASDTVFYPFVH